MPTKIPTITARIKKLHGESWIILDRGHLASLKVRLTEAHDLADQLHDLAEQEDT